MTPLEILEAHLYQAAHFEDMENHCSCGHQYGESIWPFKHPREMHHTHVAEVFDQHMQEREVAVLLKARDRMAKHWPLALDEFEAGEVCDWLEHEADKVKESSDGAE